jgi:hypothetical protein
MCGITPGDADLDSDVDLNVESERSQPRRTQSVNNNFLCPIDTLEARLERLIARTMREGALELSQGGNFFAGAKLVLRAMRLKWTLEGATQHLGAN